MPHLGEKCSVDLMHSLVPHAALPDYRFRGMHLKMSAVHVPGGHQWDGVCWLLEIWNWLTFVAVSCQSLSTAVVGCTRQAYFGIRYHMTSYKHMFIASWLWLAGVFKSWHESGILTTSLVCPGIQEMEITLVPTLSLTSWLFKPTYGGAFLAWDPRRIIDL